MNKSLRTYDFGYYFNGSWLMTSEMEARSWRKIKRDH